MVLHKCLSPPDLPAALVWGRANGWVLGEKCVQLPPLYSFTFGRRRHAAVSRHGKKKKKIKLTGTMRNSKQR